ncbi:MAG TPA: hypothetical protein VF618_25820 [Thermoanaerobaculia bacterium]
MWVFDGEEWRQDDGSESTSVKPVSNRPQPMPIYDDMIPELQVLEIVPVPRTNHDIPPFPMV